MIFFHNRKLLTLSFYLVILYLFVMAVGIIGLLSGFLTPIEAGLIAKEGIAWRLLAIMGGLAGIYLWIGVILFWRAHDDDPTPLFGLLFLTVLYAVIYFHRKMKKSPLLSGD